MQEELRDIANTNSVAVHNGYMAIERRLVQTLPRANWDYSFGIASGWFKSPNKLKTIFPDGTIERQHYVALKVDQALTTFANPQETNAQIEDPYAYTQDDGKVCALQAWTLTYNEQYKNRCVGGIEPTNALDQAALTNVFVANEHFRGGYTVEDCVRITMERANQLQKVAAHVRQPTTGLEEPYLCAFTSNVDDHVYIGGVTRMIAFLSNPSVQKALGVEEFVGEKGRVVVKSFEEGREGATQSFQFSVASEQPLVVYKRRGRMQFWCVKLLKQFHEEAKEGEKL